MRSQESAFRIQPKLIPNHPFPLFRMQRIATEKPSAKNQRSLLTPDP
jgi:hypothetical protein